MALQQLHLLAVQTLENQQFLTGLPAIEFRSLKIHRV